MVGNSLVIRGSRFLAVPFAIWFTASCVVASILPTQAIAQSLNQSESQSNDQSLPDFESPIIEHTELDGGPLGAVEVFGATVVDNDDIGSVTLFYRFSGESEYAQVSMREIASSSFYSAKVDTANVPLGTDSIEYYLQAEDASGNLVLKGFAFQPLVRFFSLSNPPADVPVTQEPIVDVEESGGVNWLYVGLGVLAVGAIAAAAGGGSSSNNNDCGSSCEVTVTFARP